MKEQYIPKGKSKKEFQKFYEEYRIPLYTFILRMVKDRELAEDLLQDTFVSAIKSIDQFDESRNFMSWLFGIAHKRTIDHFRHETIVNNNRDKEFSTVGTNVDTPDKEFDKQEFRIVLSNVVNSLSPVQKEVFLNREMGGVSFKDIAYITGTSVNTALGRMRLAMKTIKEEFEKRGIYGMQNVGS
jgi:RNA polymerase sigma-70 factor (ECF subfamily)